MASKAKTDAVNEPSHAMTGQLARLEQALVRAENAAAQITARHAHLRAETQTAVKALDTLLSRTRGENG